MALVIRHPEEPRLVLAVLRPPDDADLPDVWGLPAATLGPSESWEDAVRRAAREKLGLEVGPGAVLNEGRRRRPAYTLEMRLYEATAAEGEPRLDLAPEGVTRYADWRWAPREALLPAAERGSLCTRLFLEVEEG